MSRRKVMFIAVSLIVCSISQSLSAWEENAEAIDVSGGEDHTLVLTKNKWPWACGPNGGTGYSGVLGTGSGSSSLIEKTLVRVWGGDMNSPSGYLQDIDDLDAGWKHSLALERYVANDPNFRGYVWAWGDDVQAPVGCAIDTDLT